MKNNYTLLAFSGWICFAAFLLISWQSTPVKTDLGENSVIGQLSEELTTTFYTEGKVFEQGKLVQGKREGVWTAFHPNGERMALGKYNDGRRINTWTYWNIDGTFNRIETFPGYSFTDDIKLDWGHVRVLAEDENADWAVLALCAREVALESEDEELEKEALAWINRSIELHPCFWNHLVKVRVLEQQDYMQAVAAAEAAVKVGIAELDNFEATPEFMALDRLIKSGGC